MVVEDGMFQDVNNSYLWMVEGEKATSGGNIRPTQTVALRVSVASTSGASQPQWKPSF